MEAKDPKKKISSISRGGSIFLVRDDPWKLGSLDRRDFAKVLAKVSSGPQNFAGWHCNGLQQGPGGNLLSPLKKDSKKIPYRVIHHTYMLEKEVNLDPTNRFSEFKELQGSHKQATLKPFGLWTRRLP